MNPPEIPFRYCFIDHMGPFEVKINNNKTKIWVLVISCMWSRAINLKICTDLTTAEFLRSLQIHSFEWGVPSYIISDPGSQLVAGANLLNDFLNDMETQNYFQEHGIKKFHFEQFVKGRKELGSLIEICVKLTKRMIYSSIGKNVLSFKDFEFLIFQTTHLVNRRPVAFKDSLRSFDGEAIPDPITPEILLRGYELLSVNLIPDLQNCPEPDPDWIYPNPTSKIKSNFSKLGKIRDNLLKIYHNEFLVTLVNQAIDDKSRYTPVNHLELGIGDLVLMKEPNLKPHQYPLARVRKVFKNVLDEVTHVELLKGKTAEVIKRHSSVLIPYLKCQLPENDSILPEPKNLSDSNSSHSNRPVRKAAIQARQKIKDIDY